MTFTSTLPKLLRALLAGLLLSSPARAQTPAPARPSAAAPPVARPRLPAAPPLAKPRPAAAPPASPAAASPAVRYRSGKAQLDQGHYAAALQLLEPLAQPAARFARAADAAYLSAVAAARLRQWPEAEQLLNLLRTEYPAYSNLPDALFLQAQVSFEQGDFDTAVKTLAQLPADRLAPEREAMKATYLPRLRERPTWLRLLKRYPDDAALARIYAEHLVAGGAFTDADRPQLDELITRFSLDRARYTPRPHVAAVKKSTYNVAVLLPFKLDDPSWQTQRNNQFVTDLYAGLRLAQDSLQRAGRPLQLFAYDTGPDTLMLKQMLAQPELAGMDLLIGPVYKSGAKLLGRYAREHQIVCVNPLSQDGDLVLDNPWHYLFGPSTATQGRLAAQFAVNAFGAGRPGVVLYEDNHDGAAFANAYKASYEAQGGKIAFLRRFNPDVDESLNAAFIGLDLGSASHLVVLSDNRRVGPYALGFLRQQPAAARPPLLCPGSWLDNPRLGVQQLNAPGVYFIHPKYFDALAPGFRRFRQLYLQHQHLPPSMYANQGFEMLLYFGSALFQYGPAFQASLAGAAPVTGAIFEAQSYGGGAHDNQIVPIVKLTNLELQVLP